MKRKPRRLWGLEKRTFPKNIQDFIDYDETMLKDLKEDPEAEKFYSKFIEEYYGNTFELTEKAKERRKRKSRTGSKRRTKKQIKQEGNIYSDSKNVHTPGGIKKCIKDFNARQRDIYNQRLKSGLASDYYNNSLGNSLIEQNSYGSEDAVIEYLDAKPGIEKKINHNIKKGKYGDIE